MSTRDNQRRRRGVALTAPAACILAALTGCVPSPDTEAGSTAPMADSPPSASPSSSPSSSAAEVENPSTVATEAITLFARPDEPERRWFAELRPYLEEEYAVEAEYIDPARIPFSEIRSGPKLNADSDNPQLVTVDFKTDDGTWTVELHQDSPEGEWLVGAIAPTTG